MRYPLALVLWFLVGNLFAQPITLHPDNPHYLQYKGKPTILITSAEHYGAVLNTAFDYKTYLETLSEEGMNYTRIFTGSYVEVPGSFGIENNTLSPAAGQFLAPWQRVQEAGLYEGEGKFDLDQWNPEYFSRLKDFITAADANNVIVEVTFFCATYQDAYWKRHPFHPDNNINQIGELKRQDFNTLKNSIVADYQLKLVEKLVQELNTFDNVIYEISNEPWADNGVKVIPTLKTLMPQRPGMAWALWSEAASPATLEWQQLMAQKVVDTERALPKKHLIAQNYCNFKQSLPEVDPNISILNFHYAWPEVVRMNYGWNRPINFDESGFGGSTDSTYLQQAWAFMLAGGAIFNNLDYSFYVGAEDGTGKNNAPGGGSTNFRKQLKFLRTFLESFSFVRMRPDYQVAAHAPGLEYQCLSEPGRQYALYLYGQSGGSIDLLLPKGNYAYKFWDVRSGNQLKEGAISSNGITTQMDVPKEYSMVALEIRRR